MSFSDPVSTYTLLKDRLIHQPTQLFVRVSPNATDRELVLAMRMLRAKVFST
jgi:hypothetical protein